MTVMVALLRGVNVGGQSKLPMADLRAIVEGCGHRDVRTYIQSGNVVLRADEPDPIAVADQLQDAIAAATSLTPLIAIRTRDELAEVVDRNPFLERSDDPTHHHVVFMTGGEVASMGGIDLAGYAPEDAAAVGQELYLFLPGGIGRSKLAADLTRRSTGGGTARNWRTVTTLLAMADELGS